MIVTASGPSSRPSLITVNGSEIKVWPAGIDLAGRHRQAGRIAGSEIHRQTARQRKGDVEPAGHRTVALGSAWRARRGPRRAAAAMSNVLLVPV